MHSPFFPLTLETPAVWPMEIAEAMSMIDLISTLVNPTIGPFVTTVSMHHIVQPGADVAPPIRPLVMPLPSHFIGDPFPTIGGLVMPDVGALAVFLPLGEDAFEERPIRPAFFAVAVVEVITPLTNILLCFISSSKRPLTVSQIIPPLPRISITIGTLQHAIAMRAIIKPLSLIARLIGPDLDACAALAATGVHVAGVEGLGRDF